MPESTSQPILISHNENNTKIASSHLKNEHGFIFTFDNSQGPLLVLDFDDADQFSINCISSENISKQKWFTSSLDNTKPMIQDSDSVVTHEFRCLTDQLGNFKLVFELVKSDGETIGRFQVDYSKLDRSNSQGRIRLDITNGNVSGISGKISCNYLHVKPFEGCQDNLNEKNHEFWRNSKGQLKGGHRGSGNSFTGSVLSDIRENTIDSFRAAYEQGKADFVEFDVTNTRDKVSVVYHDLGLAIDGQATTINKQTSTALHEACTNDPKTRVKHLSQIDGRAGNLKFDVSKPWKMPLLIEMFKELPEKLAFNLEVKWPVVNVKNQSENMLHQDPHWFDINEYVDDILKVVMENRGQRNLIFSCFDPDVCYSLQQKQSIFPVMQLLNGDSGHYTDARDLRIRRNCTAIKWSKHVGYLAINTLVKDVLGNYDVVSEAHKAGLKICVYGDDMQDLEVLGRLKESELDALCYDVIHKVQ